MGTDAAALRSVPRRYAAHGIATQCFRYLAVASQHDASYRDASQRRAPLRRALLRAAPQRFLLSDICLGPAPPHSAAPRGAPHRNASNHRNIRGELQMISGWLVCIVESGRDHIAEKNLRRAGWRCYFPVYRKLLAGVRIDETGRRIRTRGVGDTVFRPLFSGYGFVAWDETVQWRSMKDAVGVLGFLLNGERPAVVNDGIVEALRSEVDAGAFDEARAAKQVRRDLVPGNTVSLSSGPYSGFMGRLVDAVDDHNRARIMVAMFGGRETLVRDIDADSLRLMAAQ